MAKISQLSLFIPVLTREMGQEADVRDAPTG